MRFVANRKLMFVLGGLVWLELSVLPMLTFGLIKPSFFSIFLVFYAFRINWKQLIALAFLVGLVKDLLTNTFFGLETAAYVAGAIVLRFFASRFDRDKRWIQLASLFLYSFCVLAFFAAFSILIQRPYRINEWMVLNALLISSYTTALGAVIFPTLEKWLHLAFNGKQYELF